RNTGTSPSRSTSTGTRAKLGGMRPLVALAAALLLACAPGQAKAEAKEGPTRILFLGNSYTYVNELPQVVKQLGAAQGHTIEVEDLSGGGATLADHWNADWERKIFAGSHWDVLVLQDQSARPLTDPKGMADSMAKWGGEA